MSYRVIYIISITKIHIEEHQTVAGCTNNKHQLTVQELNLFLIELKLKKTFSFTSKKLQMMYPRAFTVKLLMNINTDDIYFFTENFCFEQTELCA